MRIEFDDLPEDARVWVFASDRDLTPPERDRLLASVDLFLNDWRAHGRPLSAARDWRDARFLAVGVDQSEAHASGCSIDGLYRSLRELERELDTSLMGGGRVFFRDAGGRIRVSDRDAFGALADRGADTPVFDMAVSTVGEWRARFEVRAGESWHATLLAAR